MIVQTKIPDAITMAGIAVRENGLVMVNVIILTNLLLAPTMMEEIVPGLPENRGLKPCSVILTKHLLTSTYFIISIIGN